MKKFLPLLLLLFSHLYGLELDSICKIKDFQYLVTVYQSMENLSPQEALKSAKDKAYNKALEYEGINVNASSVFMESEGNKKFTDIFAKYLSTCSKGTIINSSIVEERKYLKDNEVKLKLVIKVTTGKQKEEKDPYFNLDASTNKTTLREGENLSLSIKCSKDCYITVLNIQSNNKINILFPNQIQDNNFLKKNEELILPTPKEINFGLEYIVSLLPSKEDDMELLKFIATKKPLNLIIDFENDQRAFEKLQETLVNIPRDQMEIINLPIYLYSK